MNNPKLVIVVFLAVAAYNIHALTQAGEAPSATVFWLHALFAVGAGAGAIGILIQLLRRTD